MKPDTEVVQTVFEHRFREGEVPEGKAAWELNAQGEGIVPLAPDTEVVQSIHLHQFREAQGLEEGQSGWELNNAVDGIVPLAPDTEVVQSYFAHQFREGQVPEGKHRVYLPHIAHFVGDAAYLS